VVCSRLGGLDMVFNRLIHKPAYNMQRGWYFACFDNVKLCVPLWARKGIKMDTRTHEWLDMLMMGGEL
jgi:hypothetical protein